MNELKFIMTVKLIQKYEERISDFVSIIEDYVAKTYNAEFIGIKQLEYGGLIFSWQRTTGYKGVYQTEFGEQFINFNTILEFLQSQNTKGETK